MAYRYITCPCGQSDGNDDIIVSSKIVGQTSNGGDIVIHEVRQCDICNKTYTVQMNYVLKFETLCE